MSIDLIGMDLKARRAEAKFTVITKTGEDTNWSNQEATKIVMKYCTQIQRLPALPEVMLLWGEYSKEQVERAINHNGFDLEVIQGYDNPELPFRPTF